MDQAIQWVYTPRGEIRGHTFRQQLLLCPKLYALAQRLDLSDVATICRNNFDKIECRCFGDFVQGWETEEISALLSGWSEDIYNGTEANDRTLRDSLKQIVVDLLRDEAWPRKHETVEAMFSKSGALAADVSVQLAKLAPARWVSLRNSARRDSS